jgi:predicted ATPase with chaperone activity
MHAKKSQKQTAGFFIPPSITNLDEVGISSLWIQDLTLKVLYYQGYLSGFNIAHKLKLPFAGIVDSILETLKREKLVEIKTVRRVGVGEGAYIYGITNLGIERAHEALERSQYAGPTPVPLEDYYNAMIHQQRNKTWISRRNLHQALNNLVLADDIFDRIGPAVNSNTSIFMYGPPGNGKTTIARSIGEMILNEQIYIPYSLFIDGQVVKLYDSGKHQKFHAEQSDRLKDSTQQNSKIDPRWISIRRPFIFTGGELTLDDLDLVFDDVNKFYEAPLQLKANGGILLIDDFGRQLVRPRDLLNRWIVPLENRIDFLTLHNGYKVEIPFDVLVIFSTNLPPKNLVDEAFLRRLRHKIQIIDPSFENYRVIFQRVAAQKGVKYNEEGLKHLLQEWYIKKKRKLRASHPRDICDQIIDISRFDKVEPEMTIEYIERAAKSFFVDL